MSAHHGKKAWPALLGLTILLVALPIAGLVLSELNWAARRFVFEELHSVLEALSASIGLVVGIVLLVRRPAFDTTPRLSCLACGLVAMSVFDIFHAAVPEGDSFVFLHDMAVLVGAFFIALAWLPNFPLFSPSRDKLVVGAVAAVSVAVCLGVVISGNAPTMTEMGQFTLAAEAINGASALLFLAAAFMFAQRYLQGEGFERLYFFVFCGLHLDAGAMFSQSALWHAEWWLWHVLRVIAYCMIAIQVWGAFRQSERRVQENELRLKTIAETARDGIVQVDHRGRVTYWSRAAEEMFGYCAEEMLGNELRQTVATAEGGAANLLEFGRPRRAREVGAVGRTAEFVGVRKDGVEFPVDVSLAGVSVHGRWNVVCTIRDASERKCTEDTLRRRTEELQEQTQQTLRAVKELELIVDNLPGFVFYKDPQNKLIRINQYMADVYGVVKSDVVGRNLFDLHRPESGDRFWWDDEEILASKKPVLNREMRWGAAESEIWVLASKIPVTVPGGSVAGVIGIAMDITEWKEAEAKLRRELSKNAVLLENNSDGIHILDLEGNVVETNSGFCSMLGRSPEELMGMNVADWDVMGRRTVFSSVIREHFEGGTRVQFTTVHERKDGSLFDVEISGLPLRVDSVPLMFYASRDITERLAAERRMEETLRELEEKNGELKQFAYVASHDLRAPLRAIDNLSQWIEEDLADQIEGDTKKQMALLRDRVNRMEALISGLLAYSRVGRVRAQQEEVHVAGLLEEIIALEEPHDGLEIRVAERMPCLVTDRVALGQVFANLISNAIKHHDKPNGHIGIGVKDAGRFYRFSVFDDGPGIAREYHDRVFVIFQTLSSQQEGSHNTGIGLAIVKKQVARMGGEIRIESPDSGGVVFSFTWPKVYPGRGRDFDGGAEVTEKDRRPTSQTRISA